MPIFIDRGAPIKSINYDHNPSTAALRAQHLPDKRRRTAADFGKLPPQSKCGRFTQHLSWGEIARLADQAGQIVNLGLRYNIAPTTRIEVIRPATGGQ